jgi:hypothetical protein
MKKLVLLFSVLMLMAGFSSCNKIEEATTVEFTASYDADLQIDLNSRSADGSFSAFATIDPASDSEFNKYIKNIKDISVESITGRVVYTDPEFILESADLRIYNDSHSAEWTYSEVPIYTGTSLIMGNEEGQWDNVSKIANSKSVYNLSLIGSVNVDELSCTIRVTITYKVKASAL